MYEYAISVLQEKLDLVLKDTKAGYVEFHMNAAELKDTIEVLQDQLAEKHGTNCITDEYQLSFDYFLTDKQLNKITKYIDKIVERKEKK